MVKLNNNKEELGLAPAKSIYKFSPLSIDYNQNGKKEPYDWEDVLGSIAHYLKENRYPDDYNNFSFRSKSWQAIRTYNRSDHYANTVIELRNEIAKQVFLSF